MDLKQRHCVVFNTSRTCDDNTEASWYRKTKIWLDIIVEDLLTTNACAWRRMSGWKPLAARVLKNYVAGTRIGWLRKSGEIKIGFKWQWNKNIQFHIKNNNQKIEISVGFTTDPAVRFLFSELSASVLAMAKLPCPRLDRSEAKLRILGRARRVRNGSEVANNQRNEHTVHKDRRNKKI